MKERDDIIPALYFLTQRLLPFNFIVPSQTENTLIRFKDLVKEYPNFKQYARQLHLDLDYEERERRRAGQHLLGLDLPGAQLRGRRADSARRVPALRRSTTIASGKGRITLATCEFQIADEKTAVQNEKGENSHERYKQRQRDVVLKRLSSGLVVPKKRLPPAP